MKGDVRFLASFAERWKNRFSENFQCWSNIRKTTFSSEKCENMPEKIQEQDKLIAGADFHVYRFFYCLFTNICRKKFLNEIREHLGKTVHFSDLEIQEAIWNFRSKKIFLTFIDFQC